MDFKLAKKDYINLNKLSNKELLDYLDITGIQNIVLLGHERMIELISDYEIKKRIFSSVRFYSATSTLSYILSCLSEKEFINFVNEETISFIENLPTKYFVFQTIFFNSNQAIASALENSYFASYILSIFSRISTFIERMVEDNAIGLFKNILKNNPDKIDYIVQLSAKNQMAIIEYIGLYEFYDINRKRNIFLYLSDEVITLLIGKEPFYQYFTELPSSTIISLLKRGLLLPTIFSRNKIFIEKISSILDPNEYRLLEQRIMNTTYNNFRRQKILHLEKSLDYLESQGFTYNYIDIEPYYSTDTILPLDMYHNLFSNEYLEQSREVFYDKQVNLVKSCEGLLYEYYSYYIYQNDIPSSIDKNMSFQTKIHDWEQGKDKQVLYDILSEATTRRLQEILIDRFFKDIAYNFLANLNSVLNFFSSIDKKLLGLNDKELKLLDARIRKYQLIIDFPSLSREDQLSLYYSFDSNIDYATLFYDDFSLARKVAYTDMNNVVFKPDCDKHLHSEELSTKYGVDVYELKGEPFYAYIHITNTKRKEAIQDTTLWQERINIFLSDPLSDIEYSIGSSVSLASDRKLDALRSVNEYVAFGYCHLEPKRIAHVYHADSYSSFRRSGTGMNKIHDINTAKDLTAKTRKYNEILYQEVSNIVFDPDVLKNYSSFQPDYLYCYDEITIWDVNVAKRLDVPILLVHTGCYLREVDDYIDYNRDNEYMTTLEETHKIITYAKK